MPALLARRFRLRLRCSSGEFLRRFSRKPFFYGVTAPMEIPMKTTLSLLFAAALSLSSMPAHAVKWDLSTMSCKQFLESGEDNIQVVLTWMDGWYKGDEDNAIIDTDVFIENAKKFGAYCGKNPTSSIVTAADEVLGK
jgi:acid stress chaperone HdeB